MILFSHKKIVDPPFCPLSTCSIRYLSRILQQFSGGLLLLVQPIFSKPPWGLQLRDLSNPIVTLGSPIQIQDPIRHHPRPIQIDFRPTQAPQAHLGTLRHYRPTQAPQAHPGSPGPILAHLGPLRITQFFIKSPLRHILHVSHGLHGSFFFYIKLHDLTFYLFYFSLFIILSISSIILFSYYFVTFP